MLFSRGCTRHVTALRPAAGYVACCGLQAAAEASPSDTLPTVAVTAWASVGEPGCVFVFVWGSCLQRELYCERMYRGVNKTTHQGCFPTIMGFPADSSRLTAEAQGVGVL